MSRCNNVHLLHLSMKNLNINSNFVTLANLFICYWFARPVLQFQKVVLTQSDPFWAVEKLCFKMDKLDEKHGNQLR